MGEKPGGDLQSGGVNISGSIGSVGGDIVGRDKITEVPTVAELDGVLRPLSESSRGRAAADARAEADAKLAALKQEGSERQERQRPHYRRSG